MVTSEEGGLPSNWQPKDLEKTVKGEFGVGADNGLPKGTRFVKNVVQLIRRRLARSGNEEAGIAVFLLNPALPKSLENNFKHVPMLDNGLTKLTGSFWLVSEVVVAGQSLLIPAHLDDDGIFKFVIEKMELGDASALILDGRTTPPSVRHYPLGLERPDECITVSVSNVPVTFAEIFASIDRTYRSGLITPSAQGAGGKLWRKPSKYLPVSDAEVKIQHALKVGLQNAFPTCTVRDEQSTPSGRLDIEIEEADALDRTKITRHAVMELKVLRARSSTGQSVGIKTINGWIQEGVTQAFEYCKNRSALKAALCCFDMRAQPTADACFKHVQEEANTKSVVLRCWHIFNSAKAYRAHAA